jgi:steroid delta-isomerase-like uncharacterized protein
MKTNVLVEFYELMNKREVDAALALCHPDLHYTERSLKNHYVGADRLGDLTRRSFEAIPTLAWQVMDTVADGDRAAVEMKMTGQLERPIVGHEPTGKPFVFYYAVFANLRDGKIAAMDLYSDPTQLEKDPE